MGARKTDSVWEYMQYCKYLLQGKEVEIREKQVVDKDGSV